MREWEYKIEINLDKHGAQDGENELDKLGCEGWELVSVLETSTQSGGHDRMFFLKRPSE